MNARRRALAAAALCLTVASAAHARRGEIVKIEPRTPDGLPNVQSPSAIAVDLKTGEVLYERNADEVREMASTGKIFVAMVARQREIDLAATTEITTTDAEFSRGGARTRLATGYAFTNHDLLRAMLVASDNRAPSALGRAVGLAPDELLRAMNELAATLGLSHTKFVDPPGIRGNESTAREMSIAFRAAMLDGVIAEILATEVIEIESVMPRRRVIRYANTNKSLRSGRYQVLGGKTGYNDRAGYCLLIAARVDGRDIAFVFLGSPYRLTRYGDFNRVVGWLLDGAPRPAK